MEIASVIGALADPRDTTPEMRSPDHLAMTGAPVQRWVAWFEGRRYGSGGGFRTRPAQVEMLNHLASLQ
jgi:hypothetical protein